MNHEMMPTSANDNDSEGRSRIVGKMEGIIASAPEAVAALPEVYLGGRGYTIENSHDQMAAETQRKVEGAEQLLEDARQRLAEAEKTGDPEAIKDAEHAARTCEMFVQAVKGEWSISSVYLDARTYNPSLAELLETMYPHLKERLQSANENFSDFEQEQAA